MWRLWARVVAALANPGHGTWPGYDDQDEDDSDMPVPNVPRGTT